MGNVKFYSTPVLEYLDYEIEGVLCESEEEGSFKDYEEINW